MTPLITQIPFLVELLGDAWLISKKKKDIHWTVRCCLIVIVCLVYVEGSDDVLVYVRGLSLSLAFYPFFDPALNILRFRELKYINYIGKNKRWDRTMQHWKDEFGVKDWMFLCVRILFTALLITLYNVL